MKVFLRYLSRPGQSGVNRPLLLLVALLLCTGWVSAQQVSGTVYDETGLGLIGVTVLVDGTTTGTVTDLDGNYSIQANPDDVLVFSFTGYAPQRIDVGSQSVINVNLEPDVAVLDQVVVTGYSQQRKGDITGAVAVLDAEELASVAASSVNQQLEGRATGVLTSTSGQAGAGTNIRIRGISSFTNNDPLIVVDGVPQFNNFLNNINPNDIASLQILKDAAAASIYGTRAANGVIIITTKSGKAGKPKITYDGYFGIQDHERGWDDILIQDPQAYASQVARVGLENAGADLVSELYDFSGGGATLPEYVYFGGQPLLGQGIDPAAEEALYQRPGFLIMRADQQGTNWWDAAFDAAPITDHTLAISGGSDAGNYRISANYFDQQGTMIETYFKRYAVRANSSWTLGKVTFGENLNISRVNNVGVPGGTQNEQGTLMQIVKFQSIIPVYDVAGNFAGAKTNGLGNGSNPVARLINGRNNEGTFDNVTGNAFMGVEIMDGLNFRTNFGINYGVGGQGNFSFPTYENSEPTTINGFNEYLQRSFNWVWTNTLSYNTTLNEVHGIGAQVGYEAVRGQFRQIQGSYTQYFLTDLSVRYLDPALAAVDSRAVNSFGSEEALLSTFGRLEYTYDNKYLVTATLRRDGSSRFAPDNRYAIFPAGSIGWRISAEPFMQGASAISDLKVRLGYGRVGNERIDNYRFVNRFGGGPTSTFYDINGNNTLATGYTATSLGDPNIGWEEKETTNLGLDLSLLDDKFNIVFDIYRSTTDNLLFNPALPSIAGLVAPPFRNIAKMQNDGFDLAATWRPQVGQVKFNITANISHYQNEVVEINGDQDVFSPRGAPEVRTAGTDYIVNQVGQPLGAFFGLVQNGIWQDQAEIDAANASDGDASTPFQANAAPGRFRWADVGSFDPETGERLSVPDGIINDADFTTIGSPHPDVTAGLNIGMDIGNLDVTAFFFGSFGNDILNTTKQFTIFRQFDSNVSTELLTDAVWTPGNTGATIPRIDNNDTESNRLSSFYVEDGSYIRLKQLQVGYTLPSTFGGGIFSRLRFYVQAQNLFTITDYSGLDPALSSFDVSGRDADDLYMGIDFGNYPTNRTIMFGVNAGF